MGKNISVFISLFIILFLNACGSNEKVDSKNQNATEEVVQIEQNDERTELSDSNLPLPVDDEAQNLDNEYNINTSVVGALYKQKCASCHGNKGEKIIKGIKIRNLDQQNFITKLTILKKDKNHKELTKDQIEQITQFITKAN